MDERYIYITFNHKLDARGSRNTLENLVTIKINFVKMKKIIYYSVIILFTQISCNPQMVQNKIQSFDLSADDKFFYFIYDKDGSSYILSYNIIEKRYFIVQHSRNAEFHNLKFSPDGEKFVFIKIENNNKSQSNLFIYDLAKKTTTLIGKSNNFIIDAIFTNDGKNILFNQARSFGNYSPIATKHFHGNDIYFLSLSDLHVKKITSFNAYGIFNLNNYKDDLYIIKIESGKFSGTYYFDLTSPDKLIDLNPEGHQEAANILFYNPTYSKITDQIALSTLSKIYLMNPKDRHTKVILKDYYDEIHDLQFFKKSANLAFFTSLDTVKILTSDGKKLRDIGVKPFN